MPKEDKCNDRTKKDDQVGFDGMCGIRIIDPDDKEQREFLTKWLENIRADCK